MPNRSHNKSFFMPLLCRFSLNDTVKPSKLHNSSNNTDPSSPKLTCIGQIKKRSTTATATTATTTGATSNRFLVCNLSESANSKSNRYTKLHKLFSGKNLISPAIDTCPINKLNGKSVTNRSKSCNGRNRIPINKKKCYVTADDPDIRKAAADEELDPPLPVVKCLRRDQESNVNLWKRRGIEVKSLQIQPIQLNLNRNPDNNNNNNGGFENMTSAATF